MYIDSVKGCKLKGRLKMTLKIFKRDDSGMLRIFASPDEVRKPGECFEITDEQKNIKQMIVQVNDIIYIDTPE